MQADEETILYSKTANGDVKYVTCNYKIKELKPKDKLVLEIDNKDFTFKFKGDLGKEGKRWELQVKNRW